VLVFPACRERELGGRLARGRCSLRVNMSGGRLPTIVVAHEHAGVLELIEATLRDRGARACLQPSIRSRRWRSFAA
jgi:hypothetical protein